MVESLHDWDALRILLAVDAEGSLRRAAATLALSQPTLGRRIGALEDEIGAPILVRHARGVTLTTEGQAMLEVARAMEERLGVLRRQLAGRKADVSGRVRLSCTEPVAMELLPPSLARLRADHPRLCVDVVVNNRASDLDRREADMAIRMFQPNRPTLVARKVGASFTAFYASPAYLEGRRPPKVLEDLREHETIGPDRDALFVQAAVQMGFAVDEMAFRTDSFATTLAWTRAGLAIGALVGAIAERDPGLVRLLEPIQRYPVWLVSHPDLFESAAVRAVWDRLAEDLPPLFA